MTDDSFRTMNVNRLSILTRTMPLSQLFLTLLFLYFIFFFFVAVSTLSIQVRGEIPFYFWTSLLFARACHVIPFELPLWQATWHPGDFFSDNFATWILFLFSMVSIETPENFCLGEYGLRTSTFFFMIIIYFSSLLDANISYRDDNHRVILLWVKITSDAYCVNDLEYVYSSSFPARFFLHSRSLEKETCAFIATNYVTWRFHLSVQRISLHSFHSAIPHWKCKVQALNKQSIHIVVAFARMIL